MKQLTIIGNIGYDAVIKEVNGSKFMQFTVAVNERFKNSLGQPVESTDWISCTSRHYALAQWLTKGKKVLCQGGLKINTYKDRNGDFKAGINMRVTHIEFLGATRKEESETPVKQDAAEGRSLSAAEGRSLSEVEGRSLSEVEGPDSSDDLPF